MRTVSRAVGRGDGDWLNVRREEDSGGVGVGVLVGVAGELSKSDKGGVTSIGVSGGDKGDKCLGNEKVSSSVLASGPKDKARPVVRVSLAGSGTFTFGRRGSSPGRGNLRVPGEEGLCNSGLDPLTLRGKRVWDKGVGDGTACWRVQ